MKFFVSSEFLDVSSGFASLLMLSSCVVDGVLISAFNPLEDFRDEFSTVRFPIFISEKKY
jgi:hypothetical protein